MIATGGADRAVSIWSVEDWDRPELIERVVGPAGHVMTIDIDRIGSRLAAGTTDGRIWIWEWRDDRLEPWATIDTGEAGVYAVRFAPDGHHLVSAGPNQRVTWWPLDVASAIEAVRHRIGDPLADHERHRLLPARA
jgi:WD40 repeat protein